MITRFSSRIHNLDESFLNKKLNGALSYDRIAGYFSSSILEIAGEAIENVKGEVRIICNSDLNAMDVQTARTAEMAIKQEWTSKIDEKVAVAGSSRFKKLYSLLISGKLHVRVLPNEYFGLIHGKAGVITKADNTKTAFIGSVNETLSAWKLNYEILWEDDSPEAVDWVQAEFDALWNHPKIVKLCDFIVQDIDRIANRKEVTLDRWRQENEPAGAIIEAPVFRKEYGLWAHQKYFVDEAFKAHISGRGARYILADMVGLGKTIQLALAAELMALHGDKPVLIIVPKTLIWQWQEEMHTLLDMPSAVWDGKQWIDENGISHPGTGPESIKKCPRIAGIISQGLITHQSEASKYLLDREYECVIVDECHRARRKNLKKDGENDIPDRNNLLAFIYKLAAKTKSLLLATATPVQLYPIEAYDLLEVLGNNNDHVLGNNFSIWRRDKKRTIDLATGITNLPATEDELWEYIRNPLPLGKENPLLFGKIRDHLEMPETQATVEGSKISLLQPVHRKRMTEASADFFKKYNPFIRHIIRRTRDFLENEVDPSTNETYLKKVEVILFGEDDKSAILLPGYLMDAYQTAEDFSHALSQRMRSSGFLKMLLLKRMGSSIEAGKKTAVKLLGEQWDEVNEEDDDDDPEAIVSEKKPQPSGLAATLTEKERNLLRKLVQQLELYQDKDPKYFVLKDLLIHGISSDGTPWMEYGCIIFSQYFDTAWDMAESLSNDLKHVEIGIYAGGKKAGIIINGEFFPKSKEEIKSHVQSGKLKILFGTDAASEGLNLQRLSTLINIDLPWNPTRLEQRKGRIQRIGQVRDLVYIYNMRYKDSVEDRIHSLLSNRLEQIHHMFGQIPDVLEDAWIEVALGRKEKALEIIDSVPLKHPFEMKYNKIEHINWESYSKVLNNVDRRSQLKKAWK